MGRMTLTYDVEQPFDNVLEAFKKGMGCIPEYICRTPHTSSVTAYTAYATYQDACQTGDEFGVYTFTSPYHAQIFDLNRDKRSHPLDTDITYRVARSVKHRMFTYRGVDYYVAQVDKYYVISDDIGLVYASQFFYGMEGYIAFDTAIAQSIGEFIACYAKALRDLLYLFNTYYAVELYDFTRSNALLACSTSVIGRYDIETAYCEVDSKARISLHGKVLAETVVNGGNVGRALLNAKAEAINNVLGFTFV